MPFSIAFISQNGSAIDIGGYGTRPKVDFWEGTLGTRDIRRASTALKKSAMGARMKRKLEAYVGLEIARNFAEGKDSKGAKWAPLSPHTARRKTQISASGSRIIIRTPSDKGAEGSEFSSGWTKERQRLDDIPGLKNFEPANAAQSKFIIPLVETGDLFKSVTTAVTRTKGEGAITSSRIKKGSAIGLVVSERHSVVAFQPSPQGKNWDKKFAVHNRPANEHTQTGKVSVPGREFFFVSQEVKKFTFLLIGLARMVGMEQPKAGDTFGKEKKKDTSKTFVHFARYTSNQIENASREGQDMPTVFEKGQGGIFAPRTISRIKGTGHYNVRSYSGGMHSKGGRRRGGGGGIKVTLQDFNAWGKIGASRLAKKVNQFQGNVGTEKTPGHELSGMPEVTMDEWISDKTTGLLNSAKILGFMKAVDAVSAARKVGKVNRKKSNTSLNQLI